MLHFCIVTTSTESMNFLQKDKMNPSLWNSLLSFLTLNLWFSQFLELQLWVGMMMWICWLSKLKLVQRIPSFSMKKINHKGFYTGKEISYISGIVSALDSTNKRMSSSLTKVSTVFIIPHSWRSLGQKNNWSGGWYRSKMVTNACW